MSFRGAFIITTALLFSTTVTTIGTAMALSTTAKTSSDRLPSMRNIDCTISHLSSSSTTELSSKAIDERIKCMAERAKNGTPLTQEEIEDVCNGLKNLAPVVEDNDSNKEIDFEGLKSLLSKAAHLSHKDWAVTSENSDQLCSALRIESESEVPSSSKRKRDESYPLAPNARQLLERIIKEGNWDGAVESATREDRTEGEKSWAVLVTGVNGIRKTTSMYQPWFGELLSEALVCPEAEEKSEESVSLNTLPTGSNSFFRQLDHMICTLCNEEFARLYSWSTSQLPKGEEAKNSVPSDEVVEKYSNYKVRSFRTKVFLRRY